MTNSKPAGALRATASNKVQKDERRRTGILFDFDLDSGSVNTTVLTDAPTQAPVQQEMVTEAPAPEQEVTTSEAPAVATTSTTSTSTTEAPVTSTITSSSNATEAPETQTPATEAPTDPLVAITSVPATEAPATTTNNTTDAPILITGAPQDLTATDTDDEDENETTTEASNSEPHEQSELQETSGVLQSLRLYDDLRARAPGDFLREATGSYVNIDELSTPEGDVAFCHLSALVPFTFGDNAPWLTAFEDAAVIALAIQHLNAGDGTIVPEVEGLNDRCNVRFTTEFADTEFAGGVTLEHVVHQTSRQPGTVDRIPCAFVGAYRSAVSLPMSIVTGLLGYPQVSGASTSADLDDTSQYPLFGRTIPTDAGNAVPIIRYIREVLNVKHLAVINVNDAYGNAYVQGMRKAAENFAPDMVLHQIPLDDDPASIPAAINSLVATEYRYVFAVVFTPQTHDALIEEAYSKVRSSFHLRWINPCALLFHFNVFFLFKSRMEISS